MSCNLLNNSFKSNTHLTFRCKRVRLSIYRGEHQKKKKKTRKKMQILLKGNTKTDNMMKAAYEKIIHMHIKQTNKQETLEGRLPTQLSGFIDEMKKFTQLLTEV